MGYTKDQNSRYAESTTAEYLGLSSASISLLGLKVFYHHLADTGKTGSLFLLECVVWFYIDFTWNLSCVILAAFLSRWSHFSSPLYALMNDLPFI